LGTNKENVADRVRKGRCASGENHPQTKLTWEKVREIRRLTKEGWGQRRLAKRFGVGKTTIFNIKNNIYWREDINKK
jgi:DNA-binding XRE family transcriptional regulator